MKPLFAIARDAISLSWAEVLSIIGQFVSHVGNGCDRFATACLSKSTNITIKIIDGVIHE